MSRIRLLVALGVLLSIAYSLSLGNNCLKTKLVEFKRNLRDGKWFKLICGASNQDLPFIRNLCMVYTLTGVDCIDISADFSVIASAKEGINAAMSQRLDGKVPLLIVSVNDGLDNHFRKALFDPRLCPPDCSRPCERICPAFAIPSVLKLPPDTDNGVLTDKCYGCNRCVKVCPYGLISTQSYQVNEALVVELLENQLIDGIEIHTAVDNELSFSKLWHAISNSIINHAKIFSISFSCMNANKTVPQEDNALVGYANTLRAILQQDPRWNEYEGIRIWQTDGRSMTGDLSKGTVRATVRFAKLMLAHRLVNQRTNPDNDDEKEEYIQLAGGTNSYSVEVAREAGLYSYLPWFGGYGFGGYARKQIVSILTALSDRTGDPNIRLEEHPKELEECVSFANTLLQTVKGR